MDAFRLLYLLLYVADVVLFVVTIFRVTPKACTTFLSQRKFCNPVEHTISKSTIGNLTKEAVVVVVVVRLVLIIVQ